MLTYKAFNPKYNNKSSSGEQQDMWMLIINEDLDRNFKCLACIENKDETVIFDEGEEHSDKADIIRYIGRYNRE
ncbi:MAG: hypothetical protein LBL90_04250 [Prevotellaceae bacterium]|nr:hypothetical protein [Prevotellaceae bacterium]